MDKDDAIMIPIPQYPLYTACISLYGGSTAPYYLDESSGWQFNIEELERAHEESVKQGKRVKAIVLINPGNPTGAILSSDTIKRVLKFSVKHKLVVVADEVDRGGCRFIVRIYTRRIPLLFHLGRCWIRSVQRSSSSASWLLCTRFRRDCWASVA